MGAIGVGHGVPADGVLIAHSWVGLLEKQLGNIKKRHYQDVWPGPPEIQTNTGKQCLPQTREQGPREQTHLSSPVAHLWRRTNKKVMNGELQERGSVEEVVVLKISRSYSQHRQSREREMDDSVIIFACQNHSQLALILSNGINGPNHS